LVSGCGGAEGDPQVSGPDTDRVTTTAPPPSGDASPTTATPTTEPAASPTSAAPSSQAGPVPSAAPGEEGYHLYVLDLLRQRLGADCTPFEGNAEESIAYVAQCTISGHGLMVLYTGETG